MWWLVIAIALGIAEVFTTFLVFGMFAVGAAGASLVASLHQGPIPQAIVFVAVSAALLVLIRPIARRHLLRTPVETRTGIAALVGQSATVIARVDASGGRVKIGGEVWSARALHPDQVLEPGTVVDVIEIKGATALVYGPEAV